MIKNVLLIFVSVLLPGVYLIADDISGELPFRSADSTSSASIRDLDNQLFKAVINGDTKAVMSLITAVANVNAYVEGDFNAQAEDKYKPVLSLAAKRGNVDIVKALIAAGANVNGVSSILEGRTALMEAATNDHADIVRVLIAAGANIEAKHLVGCTALMAAAGASSYERDSAINAVRALITAGANVNASDSVGCTSLMKAAQYNNVHTVRALVAAGADVNVTDRRGWTALEWADQSNAETVYSILYALTKK